MNLDELLVKTQEWAHEKGLSPEEGDPFKQLAKLTEEVGETNGMFLRHIAKLEAGDLESAREYGDEVLDGIGDIFVSLVVFCYMTGFDAQEGWNLAYDTISKRVGKAKNGAFTKEGD